MTHEFTDEDRDKPVRTADGERIGTVSDVSGGRASIEEEDGITGAVKEALGWGGDGDGRNDADGRARTYELDDAAVDRVDDDGVWIRQI